jgi:chaperonin GroES
MKIKPLHNHVVIKQQDETETMYGNIIVPDAGKEKPLMGEVVAVGPGIVNMNGALIPNTLEVGQKVSFPSFGGQKLSIGGEDYLIYKEQDIFAILED